MSVLVPLKVGQGKSVRGVLAIRQSDYVFPGAYSSKAIGKNTPRWLVRQLIGRRVTVHGFRSSFRDWAAERTSFPREIAEAALAHAVPSQVEAAYRRTDFFDRRRKLMDTWASYCAQPAASGKVLPIRAR